MTLKHSLFKINCLYIWQYTLTIFKDNK